MNYFDLLKLTHEFCKKNGLEIESKSYYKSNGSEQYRSLTMLRPLKFKDNDGSISIVCENDTIEFLYYRNGITRRREFCINDVSIFYINEILLRFFK